MRRFNGVTWLVLAALGMAGCQKPYFMTELDYAYYNDVSSSYGHGVYDEIPEVAYLPPRDVTNPEAQEEWHLTLEQAKQIALQNNKQIAFLAYQPAEAGTAIDLALSRFDAVLQAGLSWSRQDRPVANNFQTFGTGQNAVQRDLFGASVFGGVGSVGSNLTSGAETTQSSVYPLQGTPGNSILELAKRNATGGVTTLSYNLSYDRQQPASSFLLINPSWGTDLNLSIEQPLLQGAGVEFNRAPILIARAQHEQSIKEFELSVHTLLRDVEQTYWQLHFAYQDLFSRETGMRQALATWQKEKNKEEVGTSATPDVAQAREQYEFFRGARLEALSRVLSTERDLRELLGIPPEDGKRIIPETPPTVAAFVPDWQLAVNEAMENRPNVVAQRFAVRAAELELLRQKNGLLPDLTVGANWRIVGLDNQYDQSVDRLTDNEFTEWGLSVRYRRQVGERSAHAATRNAQLALSRQRRTLDNLQHTVFIELNEAYQNIVTQFELIQILKFRREAAVQNLEAQEQFYRLGTKTIDDVLQAQTAFADALRAESQAVVAYNQALAQWQFAKGTILENDNVALAEQQISLADSNLSEQRWRAWLKSLPIPIHPGKHVHKNYEECPDDRPLYPLEVFGTPGEQAPPAALQVPEESATPIPDERLDDTARPVKPEEPSDAPQSPEAAPPANSTEPPGEFRPLPVPTLP